MSHQVNRRQALERIALAGTSWLAGAPAAAEQADLHVAGRPVEITVASVSAHTVRLTVAPIQDGAPQPIPHDGSLVRQSWGPPQARVRRLSGPEVIRCGDLVVKLSSAPLQFRLEGRDGRLVQQLGLEPESGALSFPLGEGPVFGLGEGGPQFDRRGLADRMRSG
jgi:alpha-glucosidase/alpha-D-xyloside xylohydrolase